MSGGVTLERVQVMRDLGVMLEEKLTFGEHVDYAVRKANRALGLLIRTLQTGKNGRYPKTANQRALLSAYYANVRSILEYGSVVWGGAAESHIQRMERVQEKFLVWVCARCRVHGMSLSYQDLAAHFGVSTLRARMQQHDLVFLRNVHRHRICSSFLVDKFPLAVPARRLRHQCLFARSFPRPRVNTVKSCVFNRAPNACNSFLNANRDVDMWEGSAYEFKKRVAAYVAKG